MRSAHYGLWRLILTLIQGSVGFAERGVTTVSNLLFAIWQHAWGGGAGHCAYQTRTLTRWPLQQVQ
ncbi:hypothetical protein NI18_09755 [Sphingomonas sp. Ant20]|nr:hypothetical protein NI18_09755 [Sphingomonas sp. Ant20]